MNHSDTIFAVSSGSGMAGIAVVRVSGPSASALIRLVTGSLPNPRRAGVHLLKDPVTSDVIDEAMVLWLPGPGSATGEDVGEFHVHGSRAVIDRLFTVFARQQNVRPAEPGEFTRRAFFNDRLDLVEAEGLADLLQARTEAQRRMAMGQFRGMASSAYEGWRSEILAISAHVEAAIDFTDEEGVGEKALADVKQRTLQLIETLTRAAGNSERADILRSGVRVVIAGAPNVGKSSVLNLLAAREAAIVSPIPGTTRDVIEASIVLGGIPVLVSDTAGLRKDTVDYVEGVGIQRARSQISDADIVVWVTSPDVADAERPVIPDVILYNKIDLLPENSIQMRNDREIGFSAMTGAGLQSLLALLETRVVQTFSGLEDAVVVRTRHRMAVEDTITLLKNSLMHAESDLELAAECLRGACHNLGRITGRVDVEDILGQIFSEFCIGK